MHSFSFIPIPIHQLSQQKYPKLVEHFPGFHYASHPHGFGGHGFHHPYHQRYNQNLYPSYQTPTFPTTLPYDYYNYPFYPCTCSQYETASMCARRRAGYNCL